MSAIKSVDEDFRRRSSSQGQDWRRTYRRTFRIITTNQLVGPKTARLAIPVSIGQFYITPFEVDAGSYAQTITVDEDTEADDGCQWIGTVDYGPYQALAKPQNPTDEQPTVSWGTAQFQTPATVDAVTGSPIANSAGDYFDPPAMRDDSRPQLEIVRNEKTFDPNYAETFRDKVNESTWWGYAEKTVKVANITGNRLLNPDFGWYWQVRYEFHIKHEDWREKILNQGMRQYDATGTKKVAIVDDRGETIQSAWPLDTSGVALPKGSTPVFLPFDLYEPVDFTPLNLDAFYLYLTSYVAPSPSS